MTDLEKVQGLVADYLDAILKLFKPGAKITILVRSADDPQGRKDFMMGDDAPQEAMNMIARRMAESVPTTISSTE